MIKAMACEILVSKFELQSCYYGHFRTNTLGKSMTPLSSQQLFFLENGFGIK